MTANNGEHAEKLGEIIGQLRELKNIVVGEDGKGGLREDIRHLTSLRDRGIGMLILLGLITTAFGSAIREWFLNIIHQGASK